MVTSDYGGMEIISTSEPKDLVDFLKCAYPIYKKNMDEYQLKSILRSYVFAKVTKGFIESRSLQLVSIVDLLVGISGQKKKSLSI